VALALVELEGDAGEQRSIAVRLGDIGDGYHRGGSGSFPDSLMKKPETPSMGSRFRGEARAAAGGLAAVISPVRARRPRRTQSAGRKAEQPASGMAPKRIPSVM